MRKLLIVFVFFLSFAAFHTTNAQVVVATPTPVTVSNPQITPPIACRGVGGCPAELNQIYQTKLQAEKCVASYDDFQQSPSTYHFWAEDPDVTAQGKADVRAKQFVQWVLSKNTIEYAQPLTDVWNHSRNIAYFLVILVAAILGVGFIVGQRANYSLKIQVWPTIAKIGAALLYITFSAAIVLLLIQLSEILMRVFIENTGANNLFNIYFSSSTGTAASGAEKDYLDFVGCRDLNLRVQEAAKSQMFILKITNITYYAIGVMLLLRKIILWFLLFVSPFLAILFPFAFIRNIGWIWIGVFFQWLFYGPLFSLFLGGIVKLWTEGIPFIFNFDRAGKGEGYIYPTAINLTYGGPAQAGKLGPINNGNYIDTFAEYIITLLMLWVALVLPWLLLRIFRDYCCDGIYAMKNILLSMHDQLRNPPTPPTGPTTPAPAGTRIAAQRTVEVPVTARLETVEQIKKTRTEEIAKTLNLTATKLTDIAQFETNRQVQTEVRQNLEYLANPAKADTPSERQKFMNLRNELFSRAIKEDTIAKQLLSATTTSGVERVQRRSELLRTVPQNTVTQVVSYTTKLPKEKVSSITTSLTDSVTTNQAAMQTLAEKAHVSSAQAQTVLSSLKGQINKPPSSIIDSIAKETGTTKEAVASVITQLAEAVKTNGELTKQIAQKEQVKEEEVQQIIAQQVPLIAEPQKHVEQTIAIPPTISLEDYEAVKKMWVGQYQKGEVPVTENVSSRKEWIEQDVVLITNTLNKLVSQDQTLQQQGFDEVGFILPIFMINNLKGQELLVYLKAKLEAAKQAQEELETEKDIEERVKAKANEVLIDLPDKKEAEKEQVMTMEQTIDEPKKESTDPSKNE